MLLQFLLTSCTPNKSTLYRTNSPVSVVTLTYTGWLHSMYVPNLMSLFHCLGCTKGSVQARSNCNRFVTKPVFTVRSCSNLAQPPSWSTTPVDCPRLLIQYIRCFPPYWRPFLHPQPEDAPCPGDRAPLMMEILLNVGSQECMCPRK